MAPKPRTDRSAAPLHVVILAAGQGTRMRSALPKVLHPIAGRPMLEHVLATAQSLGAACCHVVVGHGAETLRAWLATAHAGATDLQLAVQAEQLGTAHAVQQAMPNIPDEARVLILYGDVPLIQADTLQALLQVSGDGLGVLTAVAPDPYGYGRIVRSAAGAVQRIVEEKDATPAQRRIAEINTGVLTAPARRLRTWLDKVGNDNAKREFYLTDVVKLASRDRVRLRTVAAESLEEVLGVNDRVQLAAQERAWQRRQALAMMRQGVGIRDAERFDLRGSLLCGQDVHLDVGVVIEGEVELGDHVHVGAYTVLRNVKIGAGTHVESHSVLDSAIVGRGCRIGPFARLRPDTRLADQVHVGNFVEIKKSTLGEGSKANHLAYLGDARIGSRVNVGAGVITCNYDGVNKHPTVIGDGAFIGTDTQLIAPVTIGAGAYIAAGSSIAMDAPADQLTICRAREQRSLPGWKRPKKQ
ncbi:bifunctional UDP-N-acetylglucosamine diphosphorylase/glucosamine-1-phosphate N-acetyltransferase GlmU [Panacagrimonas sp.]|uniref:bifunctional UDP-N-acetylglucosamine diphosphorylase/glucosamine-1-phosphate N-acetyltransferase GlmU n=1 Tax=Panacagrimonas sp. TaxID=2480088 RepID=UPI003B521B10